MLTSSGTRVTMTRGAEASGAAQPANTTRLRATSAIRCHALISCERFPILVMPSPQLRMLCTAPVAPRY
jgi:hypothetical protein